MLREIKKNKFGGVLNESKKIPLRMCVITKEKLEKRDLFRIVRTPEKEVVLDLSGKLNGKGAYLKRDLEVINKAKKSKILDRVWEIEVPDNLYKELEENLDKEGEN